MDALVHGLVLLVVLLEREQIDERGEHVGNGHLVGVRHDHAAHAAGGVVLEASILDLQQGLELGQDVGDLG